MLDEDESFSLQANIQSPGYVRVALTGLLVKKRGGKTYVTSLLPGYFYGASGAQLSGSWRQHIGVTGAQTILSRSGGQPEPAGQRIWKEVKQPKTEVAETVKVAVLNPAVVIAVPLVIGLALLLVVVFNG